jgi:predicted aspartyl protease
MHAELPDVTPVVAAMPTTSPVTVTSSENCILPTEFSQLETMSGYTFTLDACAHDSGNNALCESFCSPSKSFLETDLDNAHIWMNAPFDQLQEFVCHYVQQKKLHPQTLSACILVPTVAALHGSLAPLFNKMQLLHHYPKGTRLFQRVDDSGSIVHLPPCPFRVSVYFDDRIPAPRHSLAAVTGDPTLDMLFQGSVAGSSAKVGVSYANILVDTGATGPFISPTMAAKLQLRVTRSPAALTLADGTTVYSAGTCHAKLSIGKFSARVRFIVAPLAPQFDVVLDNSWLRERKAAIDYGDGSLTLYKGRKKIVVTKPTPASTTNTTADGDSSDANVSTSELDQQIHTISAMQAKRAIRKKARHFAVVVTKTNASSDENVIHLSGMPDVSTVSPALASLLNKYQDRFPESLPELVDGDKPPLYKGHTIPLVEPHKPPVRPIYRLSPLELAELKKQIKEMLAVWVSSSRVLHHMVLLYCLCKRRMARLECALIIGHLTN